MKKIAILQINYLPWKGYFDMIAAVDEVWGHALRRQVIYIRDWQNPNQI
jgi:hypothetical protein